MIDQLALSNPSVAFLKARPISSFPPPWEFLGSQPSSCVPSATAALPPRRRPRRPGRWDTEPPDLRAVCPRLSTPRTPPQVDVDEQQEAAAAEGVRSMPTFKFYLGGRPLPQEGFSGADANRVAGAVARLAPPAPQ